MTDNTALDALKAITTRNFYALSPLERAIWMYADNGGTKAVEAAAQLSDLLVENDALRSQLAEAEAERERLRTGIAEYIKDCRASAANSYKTPRNRGWAEALVDVAGILEELLEARTDARGAGRKGKL